MPYVSGFAQIPNFASRTHNPGQSYLEMARVLHFENAAREHRMGVEFVLARQSSLEDLVDAAQAQVDSKKRKGESLDCAEIRNLRADVKRREKNLDAAYAKYVDPGPKIPPLLQWQLSFAGYEGSDGRSSPATREDVIADTDEDAPEGALPIGQAGARTRKYAVQQDVAGTRYQPVPGSSPPLKRQRSHGKADDAADLVPHIDRSRHESA